VAHRSFDALVIPGGSTGTRRLRDSGAVATVVRSAAERGALLGAICAGPTVLLDLGLLRGRHVTGHASVREELAAGGASVEDEPVVQDGRLVTAAGAGLAVPFGLVLVSELLGAEAASRAAAGMMLRGEVL
jgi:putative intracellular protease/amidase